MLCSPPSLAGSAKSCTGSDILADAHLEVFEIDSFTGFMAPRPPPARLPIEWEAWEVTLEEAVKRKVQLGNKIGLTREETACSETWRASVRTVRSIQMQ